MRSPNPMWWRQSGAAAAHPGLLGAILSLSVVAVGATIYLSPVSGHGDQKVSAAPPAPASTPSPNDIKATPSDAAATTSATPKPSASTIARTFGSKDVIARKTVTASATPKAVYCTQFAWQQDAQAAYLANLSDPYGLDGGAGPHNGDGIACSMLPVDPARPASVPVDPFVAPPATAASKQALLAPSQDYFGVMQNGLPNATNQYDALTAEVGKAPSSIGYFQYWNRPFDPTKVQTAWQHDALPVMTWMSKSDDGSVPDANFSLKNIAAGNFDTYLRKYAGDIRAANLPVAIRFDHEMNGNWYPWAAGGCGPCHTTGKTTSADYIAAWRHVWQIFDDVGANQDVIWLWAPGRPDGLSTNPASGITSIAADYPGDQYVDWVGATVYWRKTDTPTDFTTTFGNTLSQLKAVAPTKPIFFGEIGAAQNTATAPPDLTKQTWIANTLAGLLADPQVVGFSWFDNAGPDAITGIVNDWRINSSPDALAAFRLQIADSRFASGTLPDTA